jgi:hypothetical protein
MNMQSEDKLIWRSPEEIVEIAFQRASVVMMNEAHDDMKRCIRTRQIGQRILPVAHQAGVRHLAMEALFPLFAEQSNSTRRLMQGNFGYLSQPEMKDFIQTALDFGWTLIPYEADNFKWLSEKHGIDFANSNENERIRRLQEFQADFTTLEFTNWREEQQALNIIRALQSLPAKTPLLVWCGNSHHSKTGGQGWIPMGYQFIKHSNIDPFVIDQTRTVKFDAEETWWYENVVKSGHELLDQQGGTGGLLREEAKTLFLREDMDDAFLFSTQNELE